MEDNTDGGGWYPVMIFRYVRKGLSTGIDFLCTLFFFFVVPFVSPPHHV